MKNPNALIAMAYVSKNSNNPFAVFCEYIKFCVYSNPKETMSLNEIRAAVSDEFGLYLPTNIAIECLYHIENEGLIETDHHLFKKAGEYNTERFIKIRNDYQETEQKLIEKLLQYGKEHNKNWTLEETREHLIKVLDRNGLAYDIFIHKKDVEKESQESSETEIKEMLPDDEDEIIVEDTAKQPLFSDAFVVGKFIDKTLSEDTIYRRYLLNICEGLMLCVGAYQLPSFGAESPSPQINGTDFFFDTRLLLRVIGCAGDAAEKAANELVDLIQSLGGNILYYSQTLEEMNRAFDYAVHCISSGSMPDDNEMRLYAAKINNSIPVIKAKKANLEKELEKRNIYLRSNDVFSEKEQLRYGFEQKDLNLFMRKYLNWDPKTIDNDALAIWETHMRRKGNYREYCGTKNRLCVFVTTNPLLIGIALRFREERPSVSNINGWRQNRLPVITDIRLTCRLWSPSKHSERMSLLYLSANALAAQRPTQSYINEIRTLAVEIQKNVPEYSNLSLTAYFDDQVTTTLFNKTKGATNEIDVGTLANTIEELSLLKVAEEKEKAEKAIAHQKELSDKLDEQNQQIKNDAIKANMNLGILGFWLNLVLLTPLIFSILCSIVSTIISAISGNWHIMWAISIPIIILCVEYVFSSNFFKKRLLKQVFPKAERALEKRINKNIRSLELPFKDDIIREIKKQNRIWNECEELLKQK